MYSVRSYFIAYKVIDLVENGLEQGKAVTINSVAQTIYQKLGREPLPLLMQKVL